MTKIFSAFLVAITLLVGGCGEKEISKEEQLKFLASQSAPKALSEIGLSGFDVKTIENKSFSLKSLPDGHSHYYIGSYDVTFAHDGKKGRLALIQKALEEAEIKDDGIVTKSMRHLDPAKENQETYIGYAWYVETDQDLTDLNKTLASYAEMVSSYHGIELLDSGSN